MGVPLGHGGFFLKEKVSCHGTIEKTSDLSTRRLERAQSLSVIQTQLGVSNVSAFSARSAVKLGGIVISLEKSIVPSTGQVDATIDVYNINFFISFSQNI